jgi:voltage-gated potassium channel
MLITNIKNLIFSLGIIIFSGTLGFVIIDNVHWFDALYMTLITVTTVGFSEAWELSTGARLWAMFIMFAGIGVFFLIVGQISRQAVDFKKIRRKRMDRSILQLQNHFILCGYGRMGRAVVSELQASNEPFVIIEANAERIEDIAENHLIHIHGDATSEEILTRAGIDKAKAIVSVLAQDPDNLFLIVTARSMSKTIPILTRANIMESIPKFKNAGATQVLNPYESAGHKMARMAMKPEVVEFLEIVTRRSNLDLLFEAIKVGEGSSILGKTIQEINVGRTFDIIITAIEKPNGAAYFNPKAEYIFAAGDKIIALGQEQSLKKFEKLSHK